jgi:hypothetical protein
MSHRRMFVSAHRDPEWRAEFDDQDDIGFCKLSLNFGDGRPLVIPDETSNVGSQQCARFAAGDFPDAAILTASCDLSRSAHLHESILPFSTVGP